MLCWFVMVGWAYIILFLFLLLLRGMSNLPGNAGSPGSETLDLSSGEKVHVSTPNLA